MLWPRTLVVEGIARDAVVVIEEALVDIAPAKMKAICSAILPRTDAMNKCWQIAGLVTITRRGDSDCDESDSIAWGPRK
jgi:hypothetical protein